MKRVLLVVMLLASLAVGQTALEMHEWGNNSGRWFVKLDTTYFSGADDTTLVGGDAFYTWPYASLFLTVGDTIAADDSIAFSVKMYQNFKNDFTTAVYIDSLTFHSSTATTYAGISAVGNYGASFPTPFLEARYTWLVLRSVVGNRVLDGNYVISALTGWSSTSGIISVY